MPARNIHKKPNKIIADHGDWLEVDVSTMAHPGKIMAINKPDWIALKKMGVGKVSAKMFNGKRSRIYAGGNTDSP